jgi:hypothetical protein
VAQFTSAGSFFVQDRSGRYYPATFLVDASGSLVVDNVLLGTPNKSPHTAQQLTLYADQQGTVMANPGNYLVVPSADFMNKMYDLGRIYGQALEIDPSGAAALLIDTFTPKFGFGDAQSSDHWNDLIVSFQHLRMPATSEPVYSAKQRFQRPTERSPQLSF